jgi:hypothetical protein
MPAWALAKSGSSKPSGEWVATKELVEGLRLKLFGKGAA